MNDHLNCTYSTDRHAITVGNQFLGLVYSVNMLVDEWFLYKLTFREVFPSLQMTRKIVRS